MFTCIKFCFAFYDGKLTLILTVVSVMRHYSMAQAVTTERMASPSAMASEEQISLEPQPMDTVG